MDTTRSISRVRTTVFLLSIPVCLREVNIYIRSHRCFKLIHMRLIYHVSTWSTRLPNLPSQTGQLNLGENSTTRYSLRIMTPVQKIYESLLCTSNSNVVTAHSVVPSRRVCHLHLFLTTTLRAIYSILTMANLVCRPAVQSTLKMTCEAFPLQVSGVGSKLDFQDGLGFAGQYIWAGSPPQSTASTRDS
jgi:hypothetical protein